MDSDFLTKIFSIGTILIQIDILFLIFYLFIYKGQKKYLDGIAKYTLHISFIIVLVSILGSLYYSEIVNFEPCELCWYQRIFHFANLLLLGLAIWRNEGKFIYPYIFASSLTGGLIAIYHNILTWLPKDLATTCSITSGVSCTENYFVEFGYITIPIMSLTIFVSVILYSYINKKYAL